MKVVCCLNFIGVRPVFFILWNRLVIIKNSSIQIPLLCLGCVWQIWKTGALHKRLNWVVLWRVQTRLGLRDSWACFTTDGVTFTRWSGLVYICHLPSRTWTKQARRKPQSIPKLNQIKRSKPRITNTKQTTSLISCAVDNYDEVLYGW